MKRFPLLLIAALFAVLPSAHAVSYIGELTSAGSPAGVGTSGASWGGSTGVKIKWEIDQVTTGVWEYIYTLTSADGTKLGTGDAKGGVSHVIFEISPNATAEDFWNFEADGVSAGAEIKTYDNSGGSNPNIPGSVYGLKMNVSNGLVYSFFSSKAPVWGDFYVKDGTAGSEDKGKPTDDDFNAAWNADFLDPDPLDPAKSGLLQGLSGQDIFKILRPDSVSDIPGTTPVVPEPSTMLLAGFGLAGTALSRRKRALAKK